MLGKKGFQCGNTIGRKQFCKLGHDTAIIGRDKCGNCKECRRKYASVHRLLNPDMHKNHALKKEFGITLVEYNKMFEAQQGLCLGCYKHQSEFKITFAVDHDHATGKVRGLLCMRCNTKVDKHSTPEVLRRLADYLERNT